MLRQQHTEVGVARNDNSLRLDGVIEDDDVRGRTKPDVNNVLDVVTVFPQMRRHNR